MVDVIFTRENPHAKSKMVVGGSGVIFSLLSLEYNFPCGSSPVSTNVYHRAGHGKAHTTNGTLLKKNIIY